MVTEEIDAGAEFVARLEQYLPVKTALWMKLEDASRWSFYVLPGQLRDTDLKPAYMEALQIGKELGNPYLDSFGVRLVLANDPLADAVEDLRQRYPATFPIWYDGSYLGGRMIEGAYVYPLPTAVPSQ